MAKQYINPAIINEVKTGITPKSPNWEVSEIAELTKIRLGEVCPDWTGIGEPDASFALAMQFCQ